MSNCRADEWCVRMYSLAKASMPIRGRTIAVGAMAVTSSQPGTWRKRSESRLCDLSIGPMMYRGAGGPQKENMKNTSKKR